MTMPPENPPSSPAPLPSAPPVPAASAPARRRSRAPLAAVAGLVIILLLVMAFMAWFDWNRAKPWINQQVSEATGRRFAIEGDLTAHWHWPQPAETGWRRWVPGVTVQADRLVMDNRSDFGRFGALDVQTDDASTATVQARAAQAPASGASAPVATPAPESGESTVPAAGYPMATLGSVSASLHLLPLLSRHVSIDTLQLTVPDVALARKADGSNNWTFDRPAKDGEPAKPNPWSVSVGRIVVRDGQLAYADAVKDLAFTAQLATIDTPAGQKASPYGVKFEVRGRYAKARIQGRGEAGHVMDLREKVVDYPLRFKARAGTVEAEVEGILSNPAALSGMDLKVMLKADSMADLYDLTGLVLPNTPPFRTRGRLVGSLAPENAVWEYRDFDGTVGESDLHGSLTYGSAKPRPRLKGTMTSRKLRLADLGPVLGAPTGEGKAEKGTSKRPGKVLPDVAFATDRWNAMDLDLTFSGQQIIRDESLPIENLRLHAVLDNAMLTLSPLQFGVAQGKIDSTVVLDSRAKPLKAQLRGNIEGLRLSGLFPKVELMEKSFGRLDGAVALNGSGQSVASMLGGASGEARLYIRDGRFSKQMLDLAALNVGSVVVSKLFGDDKEVQLRCAVADFSVKDGIAQTRSVKLSTNEATVEATGTADLGREHLDLRIKPESLQWKFFSLRTPLYVRGPFAEPKVGLEAGPLLLRAGAAVAAAVVAPVALALAPITVPAADDDENCAVLLARAGDKVQGGAAGAAPKPPASSHTPAPAPAR
ncbi:AsmA family protein [Acidovorax sp. SUPP3334]|uniref:AsmA family protein n=1 Tax=Acidovorax sp. SUPP3334 TaxID=2920881 RepID=UPI0023DE26C4|nr:AsmA family protein [Acidovorax sp. SUPP3334]GKT20262.1 AsmA family protein [Acidovorax sp. SUPP3334]